MNTCSEFRRVAVPVGLLLVLLTVFGCATRKVDWGARVGTYTFDQAVLEMGPPAKQATLQDGTLVADWLVQRGYTQTTYAPGYYRHRYYGPAMAAPIVSSSPDVFVRLTFGPDGKLASWKKVWL